MKVVCINKSNNRYMKHHYFTIGNHYICKKSDYTVDGIDYTGFFIKNDRGKIISFNDWQLKQNFKLLDEIREEKLNLIGI